MFTIFDRVYISVTDGRTDRQTDLVADCSIVAEMQRMLQYRSYWP